ncbi:MAG: UDP-N-acetylmuramoyl-tripeptide--D-alanyl-D-alanine ligase [Flavobacteriia bacterium]|nr:UDP-N-acetylmuramoyl-tripeptide--D-alanyl-D-alanine ligase [Flavobacteriia bacterium]
MNFQILHEQIFSGARVRIDSRQVTTGDVFFTVSGDRFNANDFVSEVLKKEPSFVVMDEDRGIQDERVLIAEDGLRALQDLARYHREKLNIPVVGLTGSNGKTTTKELFHAVLSSRYQCRATAGNLNNHIGVPLSLLSIQEQDEVAIIEMGANHQKEIEFLCSIAQPDIGYITNFGLAHLEGFGGPEGVIKGKSELYDHLRAYGKKALVCSDDSEQVRRSEGIERLLFGQKEKDPFCFSTHKEGPTFQMKYQEKVVHTQLSGAYNFTNVASAFSLGLMFEMEEEEIIQAIESYIPTNQRSQLQRSEGNNQLIIDCYNANPSSVENALESLARFTGKRIALLGDMLELGAYEKKEHQRMLDCAKSLGIDEIITVGPIFASLKNEKVHSFLETEHARSFIEKQAHNQCTILIKGSRGMRMEQLIDLL